MHEPQAVGAPPLGGSPPPAPPAAGEPGRGPDPADPGTPIIVRLGRMTLGDLGHPLVDARILIAILMRDGGVGAWLRARGMSTEHLDPPPIIARHGRPLAPVARRATVEEIAIFERRDAQRLRDLGRLVADARQPDRREIDVHLDDLAVGDLGSSRTDSRLVSAIAVRGGAISDWLSDRLVDEAGVERAFPGSSWT